MMFPLNETCIRLWCLDQASGKLMILDQLLQKLHNSGHRVLLFAQMTHTLDILQVSCPFTKKSLIISSAKLDSVRFVLRSVSIFNVGFS